MIPLLTGALVAALLGGPHCVGMCGPFSTAAGPAWHAGRLTTYVGLGALAGAAGRASFLDARLTAGLSVVLLVWFAARLAGFTPHWSPPSFGLPALATAALRRGGQAGRFAFGVVSGLLPCGLLWSALALAVPAGSALGGAAILATFWLGTIPALGAAAHALRRLATARPWLRRAVAAGVLAAGLFSVGVRSQLTEAQPACHRSAP